VWTGYSFCLGSESPECLGCVEEPREGGTEARDGGDAAAAEKCDVAINYLTTTWCGVHGVRPKVLTQVS